MSLLAEIFAVHREGCLPSAEALPMLDDVAATVRQTGEFTWEADSAEAAAAWLLLVVHDTYSVDESGKGILPGASFTNLLGFRGQFARFPELRPSRCRLGAHERQVQSAALGWFAGTLNGLIVENYRYVNGTVPNFPMDPEDGLMVGQHYGLATNYVDWSWDPLVSVVFALHGLPPGERGTVLVWPQAVDDPMSFCLPPTAAKRVWRQRGYFQQLPCFDGTDTNVDVLLTVLNRSPVARQVSSFPRIEFAADGAARTDADRQYSALLVDDDPLVRLKDWAVDVARDFGPPTLNRWQMEDAERVRKDLRRLGAPEMPDPAGEGFAEDLDLVVDYIDAMSVRRKANEYPTFGPAVAAMGKRTFTSLSLVPTGLPPRAMELSRFTRLTQADVWLQGWEFFPELWFHPRAV
ncbi:FRG domain-containing protein [Paractinoplanes globisporus]|uniref:FRG domain-containing protein n=1 Tax=Paractinoplanes globisporus TaxID=113565 RepID=A0ABW6WTP8_9ACTN|nr:FRG domain-containing protein [Actinoplanes globisporus]